MRRLRVACTAACASGTITPTTGTPAAPAGPAAPPRWRCCTRRRPSSRPAARGRRRSRARSARTSSRRPRPVRQARVVAEVDEVLVRHRHEALVQDGQAADAGVEDTDGPGIRHGAILGRRRTCRLRILSLDGGQRQDRDLLLGGRRPRRSTGIRRARRRRSAWPTTPSASRRSRSTRPTTACRPEQMVQGWADRTPPGFVMHVKAFGLMTRHPVKLEQVPPDLREGLPVDERGRVDRPPARRAAAVFREFLDALDAAARGGQARRAPLPDAAVRRLEAVVARLPRVGARPGRRPTRFLFEPRHRSWYAEEHPGRAARGGSRSGGCPGSSVDAPKVDAGNVPETLVAVTTPTGVRALPRPQRRHLERARRFGRRSASTTSTTRRSSREWVVAAARAVERRRGGVRVLQQQQPDQRRRAGAGRRATAAQAARRGARTHRLMRVLAVTHGPLVGPSCFGDVVGEDGHELHRVGDPPAGSAAARRLRRRDRLRRRPERR